MEYVFNKMRQVYTSANHAEEVLQGLQKIECPLTKTARMLAVLYSRKELGRVVFSVDEMYPATRAGYKNEMVILENPKDIYVGVNRTPMFGNDWIPHLYRRIGIHCELLNAKTFPRLVFTTGERFSKKKGIDVFYSEDCWVTSERQQIFLDQMDSYDVVTIHFEYKGPQKWKIRRGHDLSKTKWGKKDVKNIFGDKNSDIVLYAEKLMLE